MYHTDKILEKWPKYKVLELTGPSGSTEHSNYIHEGKFVFVNLRQKCVDHQNTTELRFFTGTLHD